jgi:hypothetical protein
MKKTVLFVFVWLTAIALSGGGLLFAGGAASREKAGQSQVVDVADVAEVQESDYLPRQNPNVKRASGNVYALPADSLNPEAERLPPPVYAISGVKNIEVHEDSFWEVVDIIITLPEKESFSRGILEGEDISDWIQNLPPGLEARAHGIKKGAKTIKIYVSGTPTITIREVVRVTIPGTYLTGGKDRPFVSPTEQESFDSWKKTQIE